MKTSVGLGLAILFIVVAVAAQAENFRCDGRSHCGQMKSCEEAMFFIRNCPNTKMDGDNDGVPCEKQWCNDDLSRERNLAPHEAYSNRNRTGLTVSSDATSVVEDGISRAFRERSRDVSLLGSGRVMELLPDDNEGGRHQRFIVQTDSGVSVLVAHNIDIAPRIDELRVGEKLTFYGEYVWNEKGGVIHWTHHDPSGQHKAGWIRYDGNKYQ